MVPATAYAAAGAIFAALITSGISVVNMVISKDQKTSEFRQAWIDALRQDLSDMIGHLFRISALCVYYVEQHKDERDKAIEKLVEDVGEDISTVSTLYHRILLRLNPDDDKEVIASVTALHDMLSSIEENMLDQDKLDKESTKLVNLSNGLLKKEWKRVKRGEPAFFYTKCFFFGTILLLPLLAFHHRSAVYGYFNADTGKEDSKSYDHYHFVSATRLHVREKPRTDAAIIATPTLGEVVNVDHTENSWDKISYYDKQNELVTGWVLHRYISNFKK
ncbi:SH3 domain-containing protein [Geomonas oryzae]|uniref:SH3 domain-containing protein n=1 Tax=Geomonas oryzae TaxID=2364273 RepID=UPI00100B6E5B|nr:SH3 domain-containing protein [Geomonas oryzae]